MLSLAGDVTTFAWKNYNNQSEFGGNARSPFHVCREISQRWPDMAQIGTVFLTMKSSV
jgi:hypothetical protein